MKYGAHVRKGGKAMLRVRALGLGWEKGVCYANASGLGQYLKSQQLRMVLRGGRLQLWQRGQWIHKFKVDIDFEAEDESLLKNLVAQDLQMLTQELFQIVGIDVCMPGKCGSHDLVVLTCQIAQGLCLWKRRSMDGMVLTIRSPSVFWM